jgi:hypothetical protein
MTASVTEDVNSASVTLDLNARLFPFGWRCCLLCGRRVVLNIAPHGLLLTACANAEHMDQARALFDRMSHMNDVAWRAMLSAYAAADSFRSAMRLCECSRTCSDHAYALSLLVVRI